MSFETWQILLLGLAYLLTLFGIAYSTDRGWIPARLVRHPAVYVMSLGVFASALAFYGMVSVAHDYGFDFLNYYLGIGVFFLFGPLFLSPLQRICQNNQLASLADLLTFRYRSQWAGVLVTLFLTLSMLPLLALQIKAVTDTAQILTTSGPGANPPVGLAFIFCAIITVFTMLYGAKQTSFRERHNGMVLAIAFETLIKTLVFLAIGLASIFGLFGGFEGLENWLAENPQPVFEAHAENSTSMGRTLMLVSFAAAVGMPHMFHMTFSEQPTRRARRASTWGLPLLLLLLSLPVLPILWGALSQGLDLPPEYYTLGIGLALESRTLSALAYIGGLSAASGIIIVSTLALASMCLNHLILPFYQPDINKDIYRWLLWIRRALIGTIILCGYLFYRAFAEQGNLSVLGLAAFSAVLQFLPGVLALLFAPDINRKGFIAGLVGGLGIWMVTLFLPALGQTGALIPGLLPGDADLEQNWPSIVLLCLGINLFLMIVVSAVSTASEDEKAAAELCSADKLERSKRQTLAFDSALAIRVALAGALGNAVAQREVDRALQDLQLEPDESRPYALRRLRDQIEVNLSGLFGATVAHDTVKRLLPYNAGGDPLATEDIHLLESRLAGRATELTGLAEGLDSLRRFYRQTLLDLPMGACILGRDHEILLWNGAMELLSGIPSSYITGALADNIPAPWASLLLDFARNRDSHQQKLDLTLEGSSRWLTLHKTHSPAGDTIILVEDITETHMLEDELIHSERLASVGRLAAGVAHEIGNPVTGIASLAQNLREESDDADVRELADDIVTQTERISAIVQTLVNFSHGGKHREAVTEESVSLFECANEAIKLLRLDKDATTIIYVNNCDGLHLALGNQQRLTQVFVNLLSNARDACQNGQTVIVSSQVIDRYTVAATVSDPGYGIAQAELEHIFEPFFTTKEPGKGTGLGLALVYSIVEDHGGTIQVDSTQGVGTDFTLKLPRSHATGTGDWTI